MIRDGAFWVNAAMHTPPPLTKTEDRRPNTDAGRVECRAGQGRAGVAGPARNRVAELHPFCDVPGGGQLALTGPARDIPGACRGGRRVVG